MKLNYRGNEFTFWGREILPGSPGKVTNVINAFDTESVRTPNGWECQLLSYSTEYGETHKWIEPKDIPLITLLQTIFFFNPLLHTEKRKEWPVYYVYAHNLAYDWTQLIKNSPFLYEMSRTGQIIKPLDFLLGKYHIRIPRGVFQGSSPFITLEVERAGGAAVVELRDTAGFYKTSLAKLAKTFNIPDKLTSENLGKIDFRTVPDDDPEKVNFITYAERDAYITRRVAEQIRELHNLFDMKKLKVSGPAFAAAALANKVPKNQALITNKGFKLALQLALDAYRGGRTGGIFHGEVWSLWIFDIHSSYPAGMRCLPSFSTLTEVIRRTDDAGPIKYKWALAMLKQYPCTLCRISGRETNSAYPALVTTLPDGKLCPVYGEFQKLATTGPEVLAGIATGGLQDVIFHEIVIYYDRKGAVSPFKLFVDEAYRVKDEAEKDTPPYTAAKLLLVAGYGKLIESHKGIKGSLAENVTVFICDPTPDEKATRKNVELAQAQMYYRMYMDALVKGEPPGATIQKFQKDMISAGLYKSGKWVPINDLQLNEHEFGYYVLPPAAAIITGIARARLYLGMWATKAVYWDTDSLFTKMDPQAVKKALEVIPPDATPKGVIPVSFGDGLGQYGIDLPRCDGYLAGVKRYYLKHKKYSWPTNDAFDFWSEFPAYEEKTKRAIHGLPNLPKEKVLPAIAALATGDNFKYKETPSPLGVKTATLDMAGAFLTEEELGEVVSQFFLDMRLNWTGSGTDETGLLDAGPWRGTVKEINLLMAEYEEKEFKKYLKILSAKNKKDFVEEKKKFKKAVLDLGGVKDSDSDYEHLPKWCKRVNGHGLDYLVSEMKLIYTYPVECANDLFELLQIYF